MQEETSSEKPGLGIKLAVYAGGLGYWGWFTPEVLDSDRMIGGAELAMIHISRGLARLGYDVSVYYGTEGEEGEYDGVHWRMATQYDPRECFDVLISWDVFFSDGVGIFKFLPCAHLKILEMQCNHPRIRPEHRVDWITAKSQWHAQAMYKFNQSLNPERFVLMPNGVDLARYAESEERVPGRVIWTSSPDRGLYHLLRIWPRVIEEVPDASLHIFYAFENLFESNKWRMNTQGRDMWYIKTHLDQPGVVHRQAVGHKTMAREQKRASLLAYPCDPPMPCEGFCISVLEALAAGTPAIVSNADALPELYGEVATMLYLPIDDDEWARRIVQLLSNDKLWRMRSRKGQQFAVQYGWERLAQRWDKFIREKLQEAKA